MDTISGRLTGKKIITFLNSEFERLEINNYEVYEVIRTRFTGDQYEDGAAKLIINFREKTNQDYSGHLLCSYSIGELQDYLRMGYRLILKDNGRNGVLSQCELEVTKL